MKMDPIDDYLNSMRGRSKVTIEQFTHVLVLAITLNRHVQQPWYKRWRRFK